MRRALLLAGLMLTAGLAGCLGDDETGRTGDQADPAAGELSPKVHDILPVEERWIASSQDGKQIHNAVYRPDTDEPVPVFINFSPYWGDTAEEGGDGFAQYLIEEYVPRGYAVVLSAIRGTGHSEGCFQIAGDLELQDLHDTIDHFANVEWSNGNIVAGGKSYDSTPQNGMIAKVPHEALKGLFHVSGISDMYRYNYRGGVPYTHGPIFNTYYYGQTWHEYGLPLPLGGGAGGESGLDDESPESLARVIDDAACAELPEMQAHGAGSGAAGAKTDYWIERDWNRYIGQSDWNGSIFFVHGLQDWNVKPDHILPWLENLPEQVQVKGWLHQNTENLGHVYPMRADWNQTMLAWLDHTLKGKDVPVDWGYEVEGTDGLWRHQDSFPAVPRGQATPHALSDPEVTTVNQTRTLLTFEVATAEGTALRYSGAPVLNVTATSTNEDPVITAILYDEAPNGTRTWMNEGVLRGLYRDGLEQPEPVPQGEPVTYQLELFPQDDVLEPGHRWILVLGKDPRYTVTSPDQLEGVMYATEATLELPMAPVDTVLAEQPDPVPCFAC